MICNDDNVRVLPTADSVLVVRRNTALAYSQPAFDKTEVAVEHGQYCAAGDAVYVYHGGMVRRVGAETAEEVDAGPIIGFYRWSGAYYFVKSKVNRSVLVRRDGQELAEFSRLYCFSGAYCYFIETAGGADEEARSSSRVVRLCLETGERKEICALELAAAHLACRYDEEGDVVCVADQHNNVHVFNGTAHIAYHWSSNKILGLALTDDYAVAVCKDRRVAKFGIISEEKRGIFNYHGEFVDVAICGNSLYLLTSAFFTVYDCATDAIAHNEALPGCAHYAGMELASAAADQGDIFRTKKKSSVVIQNSLGDAGAVYAASEGAVGFAVDSVAFLLGSRGFIAQFEMPFSRNYLSGSHLVSVEPRKSKTLFHVYTVHSDRLVYAYKKEVDRADVSAAYVTASGLYYRAKSAIYRVGNLSNAVPVYRGDSFRVSATGDALVLDERGIFSLDSAAYLVKQKQVVDCCSCGGRMLFYIANSGLYVENAGERTLLDKLDGFVSMASRPSEEASFTVLRTVSGKKYLCSYRLAEEAIECISEECLGADVCAIVTEWAFETAAKQLWLKE